jgi:hypothetical protein
MNERIRELAKQAGIAVWGDAVYMYDPKDTLDSTVMEKFAELIVRECILISRTSTDGFTAGRRMEERFGVEQ